MTTFHQMGLKKEILNALSDMGFEQPTSIQAKAIPLIIASTQDFIGRAQTGTGKTGAFGIPILNNLDLNQITYNPSSVLRASYASRSPRVQNFAKHLPTVRWCRSTEDRAWIHSICLEKQSTDCCGYRKSPRSRQP
jgi:ATP-dependent RNA helicase DeaD